MHHPFQKNTIYCIFLFLCKYRRACSLSSSCKRDYGSTHWIKQTLTNLNFRFMWKRVSWQCILWSAGISGTNKHRKKPSLGIVLIILNLLLMLYSATAFLFVFNLETNSFCSSWAQFQYYKTEFLMYSTFVSVSKYLPPSFLSSTFMLCSLSHTFSDKLWKSVEIIGSFLSHTVGPYTYTAVPFPVKRFV